MNYFEVNPGGNVTAIVRGNFSKRDKVEIAKKILSQNKKVEQVGFWVNSEKADARLEMAGGEFCGNATRVLAFLVSSEINRDTIYLESSGLNEIVQCCRYKDGTTQITLPMNLFSIASAKADFTLVNLPGISHLLTTDSVALADVPTILKKYGLSSKPAAGVISYKFDNGLITIKPLVWVSLTETLYEETACASGSLAVAFALNKKNTSSLFRVKQPSGYVLTVNKNDSEIKLVGPIVEVKIQKIN